MTRDRPAESLTRAFARLLGGWAADDPALQERCRLLLLDGLAVAAAGAAEPGPSLMARRVREDVPAGPARVIGHGFASAPVMAARVNGMSMHVLDFEPMWNPPNHALSTLLPALLALAEVREQILAETQGLRLLRAVAIGVEAQGRLRLASGQIEPARLTLHPPGAVGPLAAALACASLLGLNEDQTVAAVGMAASRAGALLANVGSMTKALHCGDAAANGLEAALLAAEGFTANGDALGDARGWGRSLFPTTFDQAPLLAPLEMPRALVPGPSWKLFPSQFGTHFAITAALEARAALVGDAAPVAAAGTRAGSAGLAEVIEKVELRTPGMPYIDRPQPESGLDGKFSWQYTTAVALLDGRVDPASFTDARRFAPDVQALLARTELMADPAISGRFDAMHVELTVILRDGQRVTRRCDAPLGSWSRPVGDERVQAKARALLEEACGPARAEAVQSVLSGRGEFSVRELMRVF